MSAFVRVVRAEMFKAVRKKRSYVLAGLWWILLPVVALILTGVLVGRTYQARHPGWSGRGGTALVRLVWSAPWDLDGFDRDVRDSQACRLMTCSRTPLMIRNATRHTKP